MKSLQKILIYILILIATSLSKISAQQINETALKSTLNKLIEFSKNKDYEKAAALIAYEGMDKKRAGKESFMASNKEELNQVKRICKKISALIELSNQHEQGNITIKKESDFEIISIDVSFKSGDQKLITAFNFVKTESGFLLFNMN